MSSSTRKTKLVAGRFRPGRLSKEKRVNHEEVLQEQIERARKRAGVTWGRGRFTISSGALFHHPLRSLPCRQKSSRAALTRGDWNPHRGDKNMKQKADYVTEGWNTRSPRGRERREEGKRTGRPGHPRHNRVIFTRDLGGDFAKEENGSLLFLRAVELSFCSFLLRDAPPSSRTRFSFYHAREIRPVGAISM